MSDSTINIMPNIGNIIVGIQHIMINQSSFNIFAKLLYIRIINAAPNNEQIMPVKNIPGSKSLRFFLSVPNKLKSKNSSFSTGGNSSDTIVNLKSLYVASPSRSNLIIKNSPLFNKGKINFILFSSEISIFISLPSGLTYSKVTSNKLQFSGNSIFNGSIISLIDLSPVFAMRNWISYNSLISLSRYLIDKSFLTI